MCMYISLFVFTKGHPEYLHCRAKRDRGMDLMSGLGGTEIKSGIAMRDAEGKRKEDAKGIESRNRAGSWERLHSRRTRLRGHDRRY